MALERDAVRRNGWMIEGTANSWSLLEWMRCICMGARLVEVLVRESDGGR